jgi:hypothetical protein
MLSGVSSVLSTASLSGRSSLQNYISLIASGVFAVELILIIILLVLYDQSTSTENLFYVSTISYLILTTIYFAWHALVKENAFELLAFSLISTILSSVAIYLSVTNQVADSYRFVSIVFFVLIQCLYYALCYKMYSLFKYTILDKLQQSVHERKLTAIRTFETFLSMLKLDFMLYVILIASFILYSLQQSSDFLAVGVSLGIVSAVVLLAHSIIGIYAVKPI